MTKTRLHASVDFGSQSNTLVNGPSLSEPTPELSDASRPWPKPLQNVSKQLRSCRARPDSVGHRIKANPVSVGAVPNSIAPPPPPRSDHFAWTSSSPDHSFEDIAERAGPEPAHSRNKYSSAAAVRSLAQAEGIVLPRALQDVAPGALRQQAAQGQQRAGSSSIGPPSQAAKSVEHRFAGGSLRSGTGA